MQQLQGNKQPKITYSNVGIDRKSTRLNSSHLVISYAVFCLKKQQFVSDQDTSFIHQKDSCPTHDDVYLIIDKDQTQFQRTTNHLPHHVTRVDHSLLTGRACW